ncbi:hypothetical protein MTQ01_12110 [Streptomyces sp. XM4193]|uniref:hypothetical protein n=1 Tax=Streptomyces sp. XM4193 TaxID=2929782 RepID=UPI001FFAC254|nr:hypothetical protein [Streptomyces sp. XM4193]MCK1796747.1 hypothetical protein [Streptomyces sp. XM4193]
MDAITAVIAVAGTLAGGVLSHLLQSRATAAANRETREERRREERLEACVRYAAAVYDCRRLMSYRWYRSNGRGGSEDPSEVSSQAFDVRTTMMERLTRVQLLVVDDELRAAADAAAEAVAELYEKDTPAEEFRAARDRSLRAHDRFVRAAAAHLR